VFQHLLSLFSSENDYSTGTINQDQALSQRSIIPTMALPKESV
jgi:hypothetical protein